MAAQTNNYLVFGENDLMTKEKGEVFFNVLVEMADEVKGYISLAETRSL